MALKPIQAVYRCKDGHVMHSLRKLDVPPAALPCNHVLEGTEEVCPKRAMLVR
jgi:hypothetical protein